MHIFIQRILIKRAVLTREPIEQFSHFRQPFRVDAACTERCLADQNRAGAERKWNFSRSRLRVRLRLGCFAIAHRRLRAKPLFHLARPGLKAIDPTLNGETPGADPVHTKRAVPKIVTLGDQSRKTPAPFALMAIEQTTCKQIVAIGKDCSSDGHIFAQHAANRVASSVNLRPDIFNDNAATSTSKLHSCCSPGAHFI